MRARNNSPMCEVCKKRFESQAMLALPFHDSAPLDAFDGTGRA